MRRTPDERRKYILDRAKIAIDTRLKARTKAEKLRTSNWAALWMCATGIRRFPRS